jgi:hypothetical protein
MPCETCANWEPKPKDPMFKQRMALCKLGAIYSYLPPTHDCKQWAQADEERIANRRAWLAGKG